ncbi:MAG: ribosome silencing factor [Eubacterium sp.]|nr:ribosome silencing factor [Eubacterium sp.]
MSSKEMAKIAYHALSDKKAENIQIIDISGISVLADYFVIADGTNQNQIEAMRDAVEEALYKAGVQVKQVEGNRSSSWLLMDYGEIIVHVFSKEDRLFYDLERIWGDGKFMDPADLEQ